MFIYQKKQNRLEDKSSSKKFDPTRKSNSSFSLCLSRFLYIIIIIITKRTKGTIRMARVCLLCMTTLSESFYIKKKKEWKNELMKNFFLVEL